MKMLKRFLEFGLIVIFAVVVGSAGISHAFSTNDLEGTWYHRSLTTQKNGGTDNFSYDVGTITFQSDGSFNR